jgi:hypothetical protein
MKRFGNLMLCLLSFAGVIYGCKLTYEGTRPCSGDGCMIHLALFGAFIVFIISGPVFYITLKRELAYFKEKDLNPTKSNL